MKKLYFFLMALMVTAIAATAAEYTVTFDSSNITSTTETIGGTKYVTLSGMQDNIELNINRGNGTNPELYNGTRIYAYQNNNLTFIAQNDMVITKVQLVGASGVNPSYVPSAKNAPSVSEGEGTVATEGSSHVFTGDGSARVTLIAGANSGMPIAYASVIVTYSDNAGSGDEGDEGDEGEEEQDIVVTFDFAQAASSFDLTGMSVPVNITANIPDEAVFSSKSEPVVTLQFDKNGSSKYAAYYNYSSSYYIQLWNQKFTVSAPEGYVIAGMQIAYAGAPLSSARVPVAPVEDPTGSWALVKTGDGYNDQDWVYTPGEPTNAITVVGRGSTSGYSQTSDKFDKIIVTLAKAEVEVKLPETLWAAGTGLAATQLTAGEAEGTFTIEELEVAEETQLIFTEDAEGALRTWGAAEAAAPSFEEANALVEGAEFAFLLEKGKYNIAVDMNTLTFTIEKIEEPVLGETYTATLDWTNIDSMTIEGVAIPTTPYGYIEFAEGTFTTKATPSVSFTISGSTKPKLYNYGSMGYYLQYNTANLGTVTAPEGYVITGVTMEYEDAYSSANYMPSTPATSETQGTWAFEGGKYVFTATTSKGTLEIKGSGTRGASFKVSKITVELTPAASFPETMYLIGDVVENAFMEPGVAMTRTEDGVYAIEGLELFPGMMAMEPGYATFFFADEENGGGSINCGAMNAMGDVVSFTEANPLQEGVQYCYEVAPGVYNLVLDLNTMSFTIEAAAVAEAPKALYAHVTGMDPVALTAENDMHTVKISIPAIDEEAEYGEFFFADAEELAEARTFGPAEHHTWLVEKAEVATFAAESDDEGTAEHALIETENKFKVIPGDYELAVNFADATAPVLAVTKLPTGVESIVAGNEGAVEYFNLQGMRVENPGTGIYIRRQGNTATTVRIIK